MELADLPNPVPGLGEILIRTAFSAISTGTEGRTVSDARKGYIAKAKSRRAEVEKVIDTARKQGIADTYRMVMNRLEALQPLGYSLSGTVVDVGPGVRGFRKGDRVACGGSEAAHSELVAVSENLCVKLPDATPLDQAAFTTIGAIAMQGVRRAELSLGESAAIIGLGLIGQLTVKLLRQAGVRAFGIDIHTGPVEAALESGAEYAALRNDETLESTIVEKSGGYGVDAVIITAGSSSTDPVDLAGRLCRHRGKVVVVGNVPTGFERKNYYRKELDLRMSASYGPGRYDPNYEQKGLDYPIGHVRWTENRNMEAFAHLLADGGMDVQNLITHRFPFDKAREAFDLVVDGTIPKMGVLLEYDTTRELTAKRPAPTKTFTATPSVSVIGAGSFATNFLLPHLGKHIPFNAVATSRPHTAENAKRKFGFQRSFTDADLLIDDDSTTAVVIATRHDSHASLALKALRAGKRVYVEKPLCLTPWEYLELEAQLNRNGSPDLMVGFNRRFAPHIVRLRSKFNAGPVAINYRINAGHVPPDHWVHDPEIGGGRILGEACHFIDLCAFISRSAIKEVAAFAMQTQPQNLDTFSASLSFENGSVANISYFSNGNKSLPKEMIEVSGGVLSARIDDFKTQTIYGQKKSVDKLKKQDKGHAAEMQAVAEALRIGKPLPISVEDSLHATAATFALLESIAQGGSAISVNQLVQSWRQEARN